MGINAEHCMGRLHFWCLNPQCLCKPLQGSWLPGQCSVHRPAVFTNSRQIRWARSSPNSRTTPRIHNAKHLHWDAFQCWIRTFTSGLCHRRLDTPAPTVSQLAEIKIVSSPLLLIVRIHCAAHQMSSGYDPLWTTKQLLLLGPWET